MPYCFVPFCKTNSVGKRKENVSFHEFPSCAETREKWLSVIPKQGKRKGAKYVPSQYSSVCGKHFRPEDYKPHGKHRKLKPDAVPSIFPLDPKCIEPMNCEQSSKILQIIEPKPSEPTCSKETDCDEDANLNFNANIACLLEPQTLLFEGSQTSNIARLDEASFSDDTIEGYQSDVKSNGHKVSGRPNRNLSIVWRKYRNVCSTLSKTRKKLKELEEKYDNLQCMYLNLLEKNQELDTIQSSAS